MYEINENKENWCVAMLLLLHWSSILEKVHGLKNWSPPGIEPGSMALNAIALTARPQRPVSSYGRPKFDMYLSWWTGRGPFNKTKIIKEIIFLYYVNVITKWTLMVA